MSPNRFNSIKKLKAIQEKTSNGRRMGRLQYVHTEECDAADGRISYYGWCQVGTRLMGGGDHFLRYVIAASICCNT